MKCNCERCSGEGTITCPDCNGTGGQWESISRTDLRRDFKNHPHLGELLNLKDDCERVITQSQRLCELNPPRQAAYNEQLAATLLVIESAAEKLMK